jgi:hypothetical protein
VGPRKWQIYLAFFDKFCDLLPPGYFHKTCNFSSESSLTFSKIHGKFKFPAKKLIENFKDDSDEKLQILKKNRGK